MKAKLIIEGKEFNIEIQDSELRELIACKSELRELIACKKETGYERVSRDKKYYYISSDADTCEYFEDGSDDGDGSRDYNAANYYSSQIVAENNARADKLIRQLRRFAVKNRVEDMRWGDNTQFKHYIVWDCGMSLGIYHCTTTKELGVVYFDSVDAAATAIDLFHDELIWYFTEYKDSL